MRGTAPLQPPLPPGHLRRGSGLPAPSPGVQHHGQHRAVSPPPPTSPPFRGAQERIFCGISTEALMKMALSRT